MLPGIFLAANRKPKLDVDASRESDYFGSGCSSVA